MVIDHKTIILSRTGDGLNLRKIAGFVNVAFFWGVMLYLMRSLVMTVWGAVNTLLGGETSGLVDAGVARMLLLYVAFIIAATSGLRFWAEYNRRRYGGKRDKRRVHPPALALAQLSEYTGFPIAKLRRMRRSKVLVAHFDEAGEMRDMDSYASVREKERLTAAGRKPASADKPDRVRRRGEPPTLPAHNGRSGVEEEVLVEYYLDPRDSGCLHIGGRVRLLDVEVEDVDLVG